MQPDPTLSKVLIAGITGIAGSYIAQHLQQAQAQIRGLSRRKPEPPLAGASYHRADLANPDSLHALDAQIEDTTHIVYAGFAPQPGASWDEVSAHNTQLFKNLLDYAQSKLPLLQRILLMQGQKYYGSHLGPFRTPTRESDARHPGANFYFDQQDLLSDYSQRNHWSWSALRPHIVCGLNLHASMNPLVLIGAFASLCKARGEPLYFPGKPTAYDTLYQATDADILGRSGVWALHADSARNEAYNITNGDLFRWRQVWEVLAEKLDMPLAEPRQQPLHEFCQENRSLWTELAQRQQLRQTDIAKLGDWQFANYIVSCDWDIAASTVKSRLDGFEDCRDSLEMWVSRMDDMQRDKILPSF